MEEAPEKGKESSHSAHATGMNEWMNEWMIEWMNGMRGILWKYSSDEIQMVQGKE